MKKRLAMWLLAVVAATAAGMETNQVVTLEWDYPEAEVCSNMVFRVYSSTRVDLPLREWPVLTNVPAPALSVSITMEPCQRFFYVTASNWWGESDPSNVASTPAPPRSGVLSIRRGK